jgi:hypothetical protein
MHFCHGVKAHKSFGQSSKSMKGIAEREKSKVFLVWQLKCLLLWFVPSACLASGAEAGEKCTGLG